MTLVANTPEELAANATAVTDESGEEQIETADESATSGENGEDEQTEDGEQRPQKKGGFQRRIEKLNTRLSEKDREIEHWRNAALRNQESPQERREKPAAAAEPQGKPQAKDYTSLEEYTEAVAEWKIDQRENAREARAAAETRKTQEQEKLQNWNKQVETGRQAHDDFDEVLETPVPVTPAMREALLTSEVGAELAYYLGQHPEAAEKIARLSPVATARELGKIEARLAKTPPAAAQAAPVSRAPKPVTPVSRATPGAKTKDPLDPSIDFGTFEKLMNKRPR
jgi:hypothetical protein